MKLEAPTPPRLSVVVTSRNDNHGGDLTRRMQIFLDCWIAQCKRHSLTSELIFVEWNPPADRPPLSEALVWPDDPGPCSVRIVTVPNHLHARLAHSDKLSLFQMIAKNVGIVRARGDFILSTNVDLVFSDALFRFFSSQSLVPGRIYRSDRVDVSAGIIEGSSLDAALAYCESHVLRAARHDGIWLVPPALTQNGGGHLADLLSPPDSMNHHAPLPKVVVAMKAIRARLPRNRFFTRWVATPIGRAVTAVVVWRINVKDFIRDYRSYFMKKNLTYGLKWISLWDPFLGFFRNIPKLHTNACGDFMLMSRADWLRLRGHPALEIFSFHLDSLSMYWAMHCGLAEERLPEQMVHYHMEHGSGWTPEGDQELYARMWSKGIPILTQSQFLGIADRISKGRYKSMHPDHLELNWGLQKEALAETVPTPRVYRAPDASSQTVGAAP